MLKHKADSITFWLKFFNGTLPPTSNSSTHVPAFHDLEPRTQASTPLSLPTHYDLAPPFLSKCTPGNCALISLSLYLACKLLKTQILISSTSHLAESSYLINTCSASIPALPSRSALTVQNALAPAILGEIVFLVQTCSMSPSPCMPSLQAKQSLLPLCPHGTLHKLLVYTAHCISCWFASD